MDVFEIPQPDVPRDKRLTREYGDSPNHTYTNVENIVDAKPYIPGVTHVPSIKASHAQQVPLNVAYQETDLRQRVKVEGVYWYAEKRTWLLE